MSIAQQKGLQVIDVRKPKKFKDLHFWNGKIVEVKCPKIAVLGTDCALGKRTTTRLLTEAMREAGFKSEMIYTGQTGWMQGAKYGFIFDSTLNDFISGEMEHALHQCWTEVKPDIIFIEGQSSLRNPSGPAGAEWLVSAAANAAVIQHHPIRKQYKDMEYYPAWLPDLADEMALIKIYGAPTVAILIRVMRGAGVPGAGVCAAAGRARKVPTSNVASLMNAARLKDAAMALSLYSSINSISSPAGPTTVAARRLL